MYKIGVIGHFGLGLDLANGQTIKTKIITEQLKKKYEGKVAIIDTHGGLKRLIIIVIELIKLIKNCENIILMVTENGLKVLVPLLYFFNKKYNRTLHYVVIGGWLEKFLKSHRSISKKLKRFNYIYVETNTMKKQLENMEYKNIIIMPNCKEINILKEENIKNTVIKEPYKVCTFSRVMKEKGIEVAINVVEKINNKYNKVILKLDIYGQIDDNQKMWFNRLRDKFPSYIKYGGVIEFDKSVEVLKEHFLLLFPTQFYTEGIPGTIIDGYAAGIPAIASRWESYDDVIEEEKTGFGYNFNDQEDLERILEKIVNNPQNVIKIKSNCLEKARDYTIDNVMKILYNRIR